MPLLKCQWIPGFNFVEHNIRIPPMQAIANRQVNQIYDLTSSMIVLVSIPWSLCLADLRPLYYELTDYHNSKGYHGIDTNTNPDAVTSYTWFTCLIICICFKTESLFTCFSTFVLYNCQTVTWCIDYLVAAISKSLTHQLSRQPVVPHVCVEHPGRRQLVHDV